MCPCLLRRQPYPEVLSAKTLCICIFDTLCISFTSFQRRHDTELPLFSSAVQGIALQNILQLTCSSSEGRRATKCIRLSCRRSRLETQNQVLCGTSHLFWSFSWNARRSFRGKTSIPNVVYLPILLRSYFSFWLQTFPANHYLQIKQNLYCSFYNWSRPQ